VKKDILEVGPAGPLEGAITLPDGRTRHLDAAAYGRDDRPRQVMLSTRCKIYRVYK
jgi:hypothetical protein